MSKSLAMISISGKVVDAQTSKPLSGATVRVKNGTQTVQTNEQGEYKILAPSTESILTISYIGYVVYEVKAGAGPTLNINLTPTGGAVLEDVVVSVGYGTKKRSDVIGAISTIKGEVVEDLPVANLGTALKNRLPGVGVSVASGKPGATTTVNVRNSITLSSQLGSADPLFVIDGLTLTKTDFDNLDASLVESITFLKDAAAAVYGAAGAKGVVIVTTKRGKPGKAVINYSGSYGISDISGKPKVLSAVEQAQAMNDSYELQNYPTNTPVFSKADLDTLARKHYSWFDELWKPSHVMRHTLSVSGGTDKLTFFAGGNYYNETGNLNDLYITKYGIRSGMNAKISPSVSASIALNTDYTLN
ncbi:MAG: carboxypeptidase-like regulatory domain-containing protein, partial [Bacteroidetes bacterium]|nr:carboxypeptidase-like regulatory domain-containing protein [Bacteroidota bacterium]